MNDDLEGLLAHALEALAKTAELRGAIVKQSLLAASDYEVDAALEIESGGQTYGYLVVCKFRVDRKILLDQIDQRQKQVGVPLMLVTDYISKDLAGHCRSIGLQFIDTQGNAHIRGCGLYIFVTGEKNRDVRLFHKAPRGLTSQGALRVVLALLSKPELTSGTLKEIAVLSGVSLGTAHNVIDDLRRRSYLVPSGKSGRKLLEPQRLAEEWVANFPTSLRTKLKGRRFSSNSAFLWQDIDIETERATWGSEVAAAKMFTHLKPASQTLYIAPQAMQDVTSELVKRFRLKPDPYGNVEFLERFWAPSVESRPGLAPPLLVYSDLLALLEPRAKETAHMIWEKFIGPTMPLS